MAKTNGLVGPIFCFVLFFILTPGIVVSLPPHASKKVVAATHAVVFIVVMNIFHVYIMKQPFSAVKSLISLVLFYLLTPGILLTLPPHGTKYEVAAVHAVVFTILHKIICMLISQKK